MKRRFAHNAGSNPQASTMKTASATLAQLSEFDELIDARSPAEFADDHLPGAINCPVLSDAQRAEIGTLYKQVSAFAARKLGAVYVAQNIAQHLAEKFQDHPKNWRPLIYCWRGGQRSGAFTTWLRLIGWQAAQLEGGYKTYRSAIVATLETLPAKFNLQVLCGATGSGKTRLLHALKVQGAQVLDLEACAAHRGSVLGGLPDTPQPSQKAFEGRIIQTLNTFDPAKPVFIEAESRKIGVLYLPTALLATLRASPCILLEASLPARLELLLEDYAFLAHDPRHLAEKLQRLSALHSRETLTRWCDLAHAADLPTLFKELIEHHYDPLYCRSQGGNFSALKNARHLSAESLSASALQKLAVELLSKPAP